MDSSYPWLPCNNKENWLHTPPCPSHKGTTNDNDRIMQTRTNWPASNIYHERNPKSTIFPSSANKQVQSSYHIHMSHLTYHISHHTSHIKLALSHPYPMSLLLLQLIQPLLEITPPPPPTRTPSLATRPHIITRFLGTLGRSQRTHNCRSCSLFWGGCCCA